MINKNNIVIFFVIFIVIFMIIWLFKKYLINKSLQNIQYKNNIIKIKIFDDYKYIKLKKNNFHVISIITDINDNFKKLVTSGKKNNIDVIPLISYKPISNGYGFIIKLLLTNEYIKYLPDDHIVMVVDGYDVIINNNQENIINKYYELTKGEKVLFSAEKACWPNSKLSSLYPETSSIYKYLNAGTYISTVKILKKLFLILMKKINTIYFQILDFKIDDQECFTEIFLFENKNLIILDNNAEIFNCLYDSINDIEFKDNKIYNKATETYPMVFHGNSNTKDFVVNDVYNYICN
jgi:procollagen-lysine,2-oxoglutarate 5-dioxygenase, invertebrate